MRTEILYIIRDKHGVMDRDNSGLSKRTAIIDFVNSKVSGVLKMDTFEYDFIWGIYEKNGYTLTEQKVILPSESL